MAQLRSDIIGFEERRTRIVVIGPENAEAFKAFWRENDLSFVGLPDPQASVLRLYGQEINLFKLGRMPAQVMVDIDGMVRYVHYGHAMYDIPQNTEIFKILDQINLEFGENA